MWQQGGNRLIQYFFDKQVWALQPFTSTNRVLDVWEGIYPETAILMGEGKETLYGSGSILFRTSGAEIFDP